VSGRRSRDRIWLATVSMGVGGAERMVLTLAEGLLARGHAVAVSGAAGPLDDELARLDVERLVLPERGRSPVGVAKDAARIASAVRAWGATVVHAQNVRMAAVAGLAARAARGPRRPPVVASFHGVAQREYGAAARVLRAADVVACVSEDLARGLRASGYPAGRIGVVRNVAPLPPPLTGDRHAELAAELRDGDGLLVVSVGRLVAQKNHERLLQAVACLAPEHSHTCFWLVGDGPLRGRLERRVRDLGLQGRVRFAGLRLDAAEVIAHADVLVFSSDSEGRSVAALEALATGTPVVSTPVHGMAELLGGRAGLVAAAPTAEALASALGEVLGDPKRRAALGAAGSALARGYSVDDMLDGYERVYAISRAGRA
jgi:glycosyltransferase involved in cell wall biosynthesis